MSVPVPLPELVDELGRRSMPAYVLTSDGTSAPHASAAFLRWNGTALVAGCGNSMARNLGSQSAAAVVVPPDDPEGYTLIIDATATVVDAPTDGSSDGPEREVHLTPSKAVLHRPGPGSGGTGCGHDCKPLDG